MTVSLPFTLTTLSDAPPDSWAAQQYRAASNTQSTDRATSGSGESSATAEDDDDDFASALATAMTMASNVSSTPVVPQTGGTSSANSQGVSASAVSPVMPQNTGTSHLTSGQEASSVSAAPVMPGVSGLAETTASGVASAIVAGDAQTLASTQNIPTTELSSELTPLRILMLQRFRVPVANANGDNATMQDVTQVSIISTDEQLSPQDAAAVLAATQAALNNSQPADYVSASAVMIPNPDKVAMELAEELAELEASEKGGKGGIASALSGAGGSRMDKLRNLLSMLTERLSIAIENGNQGTAGESTASAYQTAMIASGVSSVMAGTTTVAEAIKIAEGVSSVMPENTSEVVNPHADTQGQNSSAPVIAGTTTSPLTTLLTDALRQPLSTQVSQAIYQHVILNSARDNSSMTVRLDPPELGEMVIRLSRTDDGIAVKVSAREPVTMDMLLARGSEIEAELSDQNLNLAGIEFLAPDTSNGGFDQWLGQNEREYPDFGARRTTNINLASNGGVSGTPVIASPSGFGQLSFRA